MSRLPLRLSVQTTMGPAISGPAWPPIWMQMGNGLGAAAEAAAGASKRSGAASATTDPEHPSCAR